MTIWYCLHYFPHCLYLFPVNITQYEVLVPCLNKMMELGVYLTPMITESTRKKLEAIAPENLPIINALARTLTDEYKTLEKTCAIDGNITAFDPLATRSSTIFSSYAAYAGRDKEAISKMPESISLIVTTLRHFKGEVDYIPVIATRKHPTGKGLNLFRPHDMFVGHQTSQAELLQKRRRYLKDRTAETPDYFIYRRLAAIVPDHAKYPH